jgi:serine kinase of HPr protein (carbohydrate metabolism regulator)
VNLQRITVHATSVFLGPACLPFGAPVNAAVLLMGDSGSGKSDVALRLIAMGARIIADDRTVLFEEAGRLFAQPAAKQNGLMEIRGVGIVKLPVAGAAPVALCVKLQPDEPPRLPDRQHNTPDAMSLAAPPPLLQLNGWSASAAAKIAAAAVAFETGSLLPADATFS